MTMKIAVLIMSIAVAAACNSTPVSPTAVAPEDVTAADIKPSPVNSANIDARVVNVDEHSITAVVTSEEGKVTVAVTNGLVSVDGRVVCLSDCNDGERARPQLVQAAIAAALATYAVYDFARGCAVPAFNDFRAGRLSQSTLEECMIQGAATVAGGAVGKHFAKIGVTRLRSVIKSAAGSAISWSQLRNLLNKKTFSTAVRLMETIAEEFIQPLYREFYGAIRAL